MRMKSVFCIILGVTLHFAVLSQTKQDLLGDWKVVDLALSPDAEPEEKQMLETLKALFMKSTFHFKANNLFTLKSPDKELATNDANWSFSESKKTVTVTERTTKGTPGVLMEIAVKSKDGKFYFLMSETPLVLVVEKIK